MRFDYDPDIIDNLPIRRVRCLRSFLLKHYPDGDVFLAIRTPSSPRSDDTIVWIPKDYHAFDDSFVFGVCVDTYSANTDSLGLIWYSSDAGYEIRILGEDAYISTEEP